MDDAITAPPPSSAPVEVLGEPVTLPVEVRAAQAHLAVWAVPTSRLTDLVDPSGLEVRSPIAGRGIVSLGAIRYLDSDLGPYHEVALAVLVRHEGRPGALIRDLAVNGDFTRAAGRTIWGFPKFLAETAIVPAGRGGVRVELAEAGDHIATIELAGGRCPAPRRTTNLDAWSFDGTTRRRTPFTMTSDAVRLRPGGGARVCFGRDHPMARRLAALELGRPIAVSHVGALRATFGAPEVA